MTLSANASQLKSGIFHDTQVELSSCFPLSSSSCLLINGLRCRLSFFLSLWAGLKVSFVQSLCFWWLGRLPLLVFAYMCFLTLLFFSFFLFDGLYFRLDGLWSCSSCMFPFSTPCHAVFVKDVWHNIKLSHTANSWVKSSDRPNQHGQPLLLVVGVKRETNSVSDVLLLNLVCWGNSGLSAKFVSKCKLFITLFPFPVKAWFCAYDPQFWNKCTKITK